MKTPITERWPEDDPVEALVAECLARLSGGGRDSIEEVCAAHPEHADELRRRRQGLVDMGLWTSKATEAKKIGRFELLRELGRGGMGVVYLAHEQEPLRRLVAVKVIGGHAPTDMLARFEAEQQTLASLVHPHIAQVLDAGRTDDGQPWYAMEFVDGNPLTHYCDERRLSIPARLDLFLQICEAVQFAHQKSVMHRDLKPGNILVCERGGKPIVKVIDFGLAKTLQGDEQAPELTEVGQILGTPEYMSPEQAMPTAAGVDTRADVYALGSILYELCAGALPFDFQELRKSGFRALQKAVCERDAPAASARVRQLGNFATEIAERMSTNTSSLIRQLSGELDWITHKALQKDRDRRYATVSELAADIRRHQNNEPVQAGPPSALYQIKKFVRRHRVSVAFSAASLVGLVGTLVVVANLLAQRTENLARFDTLQIVLDLKELQERVESDTWPPVPNKLQDIDGWLAEAHAITDRLPLYQEQLAALEAEGEQLDGDWRFQALRDHFLHTRLGELVALCEQLVGEEGDVTAAEARREWAAGLQSETLDSHQAAWDEAIATIADRDQCPKYEGLVIEPQLGFVPLGRDEQSELYEFAYPQDGRELPERKDGRWVIEKDTCMVFVLIPGGEASLGIAWPEESLPAELRPPNRPHDTEFQPGEGGQGGDVVRVRLDPFLLSKCETSQAQWQHLMGENPSAYSPDTHPGKVTLRHPVGAISLPSAKQAARRLGLQVPTGAQWQYAARAGCEAPWWTGMEISGWHGRENIADATFAESRGKPEKGESDLTFADGFVYTAPVDGLAPNAFGIHNVLGNVREWSVDPAHRYHEAVPRDGDGALRPRRPLGPGEAMDTVRGHVLGGSWATAWIDARSTRRTRVPVRQAAGTFGLRLAAPLAPRRQ